MYPKFFLLDVECSIIVSLNVHNILKMLIHEKHGNIKRERIFKYFLCTEMMIVLVLKKRHFKYTA